MWWAFKQLAVPLNYLRIRHGHGLFHSKVVYDFVLPIVFSLFTVITFHWIGSSLSIFTNQELVKRVLDLLALMIVFYMAALAAVSTFDRDGIDSLLKDEDALLKVTDSHGKKKDKKLSYRQFISYLFGYLSFLSLCLYMFMTMTAFVWDDFTKNFEKNQDKVLLLVYFIEPIVFLITFFFIWQLTFTSLLGIYFLTERIQTLNEDS